MRFRCTEAVAEPVEIAKFAVWNLGQDAPATTTEATAQAK